MSCATAPPEFSQDRQNGEPYERIGIINALMDQSSLFTEETRDMNSYILKEKLLTQLSGNSILAQQKSFYESHRIPGDYTYD